MQIVSEREITEELDISKDKIPAFNGRNYPIEYLNSREFELMCYFIFKSDIDLGINTNKYNTVRLMKGTSDRGRDLLLQFDDQNVGVIQCKRYDSLLTKPGIAREIIKFVLHAIQDKTLITDQTNFVYYFVAMKGFNERATQFLSNFNKEAIDSTYLQNWTLEVISDNVSFKNMNYENVLPQLTSILSQIKIEPIQGVDLDLKLKNNKHIVSMFFDVEKVASEKMLRDVFEEFTGFKSDEDLEKIRQKLKNIPKENRLYFGLFDLYGYDEGFYKKLLNGKSLMYQIAELKSELSRNFLDYLQDSISKNIFVFISGMSDISAFTKSLMQPYLFNKYALEFNIAESGMLASKIKEEVKKDSLIYKYQTLEEHKNYGLEVGQKVLNNDFSSFVGDQKLLELKINIARFTYGTYANVDEMEKRFYSDMKILKPILNMVEDEIKKIMPTNPTLIIGNGGLGDSEKDLVNLFAKLKRFE